MLIVTFSLPPPSAADVAVATTAAQLLACGGGGMSTGRKWSRVNSGASSVHPSVLHSQLCKTACQNRSRMAENLSRNICSETLTPLARPTPHVSQREQDRTDPLNVSPF